jgi:hypothetical protein
MGKKSQNALDRLAHELCQRVQHVVVRDQSHFDVVAMDVVKPGKGCNGTFVCGLVAPDLNNEDASVGVALAG